VNLGGKSLGDDGQEYEEKALLVETGGDKRLPRITILAQ
jgi:hypothetical protein